MTAGADTIVRLRGLAQRLLERDDADAAWFATCLAEYESGAVYGLTLGAAFGLRPGAGKAPWWTREARERRDDLIRQLIAQHYSALSRRAATLALLREVRKYEAAGWKADRRYRSPSSRRSELQRQLFELLKIGAPVTAHTINKAQRGCGLKPPGLKPHGPGDTAPKEITCEH